MMLFILLFTLIMVMTKLFFKEWLHNVSYSKVLFIRNSLDYERGTADHFLYPQYLALC